MNKYEADKMNATQGNTLYYDSQKKRLIVYDKSGEYLSEIGMDIHTWENLSDDLLKLYIDSKFEPWTDKDREEIAEALHNARDWKEDRIAERELKNKKDEVEIEWE